MTGDDDNNQGSAIGRLIEAVLTAAFTAVLTGLIERWFKKDEDEEETEVEVQVEKPKRKRRTQ